MHLIFTKKSSLFAFFLLLVGSPLFAQSAENTAVNYLRKNLKQLSLTEADISNYRVNDEVYTKHNGVTSIYLLQTHEGLEVFNAMINVNILPSGEILSMGNKYIPKLAEKVNTTIPQISMEAAITAVQNKFGLQNYIPLFEKERISETEAYFEETGIALEPIKVKLVLQPIENEVRLAWNVTLYELSAKNWWNTRVDAITGEVLHFHNHVIHCDFGSPEDTCTKNHEHTHTAKIEKTTFAPPPTNNAYNVFPIPLESPNHGDQELILNPAIPSASPFGWHDTDGEPGHEFTITRGNNVHAYHDIFDQNQSTGNEPDGGDSLVFDFVYDENNTQPYTQLDAATTNLFYWNNIIHDLWYQYGFDEAAGNFQSNNYGNGGQGDDYVRAEAVDGSGTDNANFATPEDGNRPRMQMYVWGGGGTAPELPTDQLEVTAPASVVGTYEMRGASFGAPLPSFDNPIISEVILVTDSIGVFSDACEDILNGDEFTGKIAMIDRGECQFGTKVFKAEQQGAIAVIICNQMNNGVVGMPGGVDGGNVTIPSAMVSLADCNTIKMGLAEGLEVIFAGSEGFAIPLPGPSGRDSDLDNGVIAHEYAHGISNRLTGGPNNTSCLQNAEQAGEGWSDWFGLVMQTTADMTAEQGRGIGTYLQFAATTSTGIRQYRYSRDMNLNPHTYGDFSSQNGVHGIGSIWCAMIWDLYWNMVDKYGFDDDLFNGTGGNNLAMQLVLDGLKLQACNPTFPEARDAIVAADVANNNGENFCLIWETFARRGLGFSAEDGGSEAFDFPPLCFNGVRVFKTTDSNINAGNTMTYTLQIVNGTTEDLTDAVVTDVFPVGTTYLEGSLSCNGTVNNGVLTIPFTNLASETLITCTYQLVVADAPFSFLQFEDTFVPGEGKFLRENGIGEQNWGLAVSNPLSGGFSIFAEGKETPTDQYLILEEPITLDGDNPALAFWHTYDTELGFDGGVVEITTNGGQNWQDLGPLFTQNGYTGTISANATTTPLAARAAFTGDDGGDYQQSIIDLTDFSGETIQVRFRFATDEGTLSEGWYVDDIEIFGSLYTITNTACIADADGEEYCSEAKTIIFGEASTATTNQQLDADIAIYPNPTQEQFFVKIANAPSQKVQLTVRSIDGRVMMAQQRNALETMQIDVAGFSAGVYMVELMMEEGVAVRKLVIE